MMALLGLIADRASSSLILWVPNSTSLPHGKPPMRTRLGLYVPIALGYTFIWPICLYVPIALGTSFIEVCCSMSSSRARTISVLLTVMVPPERQ